MIWMIVKRLWAIKSVKIAVIVGLALLIAFGYVKYTNKKIDDLKEDKILNDVELDSAENKIGDLEAEKKISDKAITDVLDEHGKIEDAVDSVGDRVNNDVAVIRNNTELKDYDGTTVDPDDIHRAVAERIVDGMWETYRCTTSHNSSCTE